MINNNNLIDDLSIDQLQKVSIGEIQNWKEIGEPDQIIIVISSPRVSGMHIAVKKLILRDKDDLTAEVVSAIVAETDQQASMIPSAITVLSRSMIDTPSVKMIQGQ